MPDLTHIIQSAPSFAWFYVPVAIVLGALHALEPGHAKSLMAAYIVSIRGTPGQAALLGVSAAIGHTVVVWILAIAGLLFGNALIVEEAEPWLTLLSGILIILLAARMLWRMWRAAPHGHDHDHHHSHAHDHHHALGHDHAHGGKTTGVTAGEIVWFGFTGGLLPCPAAIAVLLICLQLRQFALGVVMVAAFSIGLAATLVAIGIMASWSLRKVSNVRRLEAIAHRLPFLSGAIMIVVGLAMTAAGANAVIARRPH